MPSMCTGPWVSSRTRLAIRNASTTPWQYPRGVILTTCMVVPSLREGLVDPFEKVRFGQIRPWLAARELVVLGPERQLIDLALHVREPRARIVLADVRAERIALALDVVVDVDSRRDELIGRTRDPHVAAHRALRLFRHLFDERLHHRSRYRSVVELLRGHAFTLEQVQ